ncbi:MAG: MlaD family protein [Treponema sp.]|jgi:phospholipid/cholesterol/gamma-HCH transport system substrate-binding protein|nr:MlaD family protein [Treponema sp.]
MKFTIRFADQIVGILIILGLGALVFVVFMLGSNQRWFSRDYQFKSYFSSASGLSDNMAVLYKGFTIGHVKSFDLAEDDRVEVWFTVFDTYVSRVHQGSVVEVIQSPIGLGSQFLFYPGIGPEPVEEGGLIPAINSPEGKRFLANGLVSIPDRDDSISIIMNRANSTLDTLNNVLTQVQEAFAGTDRTTLGRTLGDVELAAAGIQNMTETLPVTIVDSINTVIGQLEQVTGQIEPILADLNEFSAKLVAPDGTVSAVLDSQGDVYTKLIDSLDSISGTLRNLERTSEFIPSQLPQVAALLLDLQTALGTAEEVLIALTNNPLLKNGIPPRVETRTGGTNPRDISF